MEKIIEIAEEIRPDVDFANEKSLIDDGILDSFDVVSIVGEISDYYDIDITADYIIPENFNSIEAMQKMVQTLLDE